jgi:hypothetical protein
LAHGISKWAATAAAYLLPNFAPLNVISQAAHAQPISGSLILFNTLYALVYSTAATAGAVVIFERRNLK